MAALVPAYLGGTAALSTDPTVGTSEVDRPDVFVPGTEDLEDGEIRVSVLGSGLPWVTKAQAAGSVFDGVWKPTARRVRVRLGRRVVIQRGQPALIRPF